MSKELHFQTDALAALTKEKEENNFPPLKSGAEPV